MRDVVVLAACAGMMAFAYLGVQAGKSEAQDVPAARYAVAAGYNFGLVVDQSTGQVWRCEAVDVACDKLRLE